MKSNHGKKYMLRFFSTPRVTFLIIFFVVGMVTVIHDPDFYLHLVAGQYILSHHSLPHMDVFSFTVPGKTWHMHEWLFEVLVAMLNVVGGERLIVWVMTAFGLFALYLVFNCGTRGKQRGIFWLLPALALLPVYLPFVTQRPQVITYAAYAIYLCALLTFKYLGERRWLWLLPPVMVVWVNTHGAFILGIAVLSLFTLTELWQWWISGRSNETLANIKVLAVVCVTTLLVSLVNPYFIKEWWFPFELMNRDAMSVISEWQRLDLSEPLFQWYLFCVLIFLGHYLSLKKMPDTTEWLLPFVMVVASFNAGRHIPIAILTLLPFFMLTLGRPSRLSSVFCRIGPRRDSVHSELGIKENILNIVLFVTTVLLLWPLSPLLQTRQQQLKEAILPVKAADYIEQHNISGRIFNQYRYGGYLLYRFYPERRVFIDIRADMYGDAMMRLYTKIYFGMNGWESALDRYNIRAVLCENDAPIVALLRQRKDFAVTYQDEHNVILVRMKP